MPDPDATESRLLRRVARRLLPLLVAMFLVSFIDRQNVAFAKLEMAQSLHLSEAAYGFGASLFFIGYLIFEIPSTLALHRYGARTWLARIMFTWGMVTIAMGFTRSFPMFYALRFLLGAAEAGFYPGVVYYLTLWFPRAYRTKALGYFTLGSALANMLGAFLGGLLLDLNGVGGLAGWQWVFIATGLPAVLLTLVALRYLPGSPEEARFLTAAQKLQLEAMVRQEIAPDVIRGHPLAALWDRRVWFFSGTYLCLSISLYGVTYWLPTLVKGFGVTFTVNGLLNAIPWGLAAGLLLWLPRKWTSDRLVLRATAVISFVGLVGFCSSVLLGSNAARFAALALGGAGIPLLYPCFWSLPPKFFLGARAAASIAAINSIGNLGGFAAQNLMPYVAHATHRDSLAMLVPAVCLTILGAGATFAILRQPRRPVVSRASSAAPEPPAR